MLTTYAESGSDTPTRFASQSIGPTLAAIVQDAEYNGAQQTTRVHGRVREESAGIGTSEGEVMLGSQTTSVGTLDSSRRVTFVMDRAGRIWWELSNQQWAEKNESAPDSIESGRPSISPPPKAAHYYRMLRPSPGEWPGCAQGRSDRLLTTFAPIAHYCGRPINDANPDAISAPPAPT